MVLKITKLNNTLFWKLSNYCYDMIQYMKIHRKLQVVPMVCKYICPPSKQSLKQAGAELCQAQVKLEVIVYIVEEALSLSCNPS